MSNKEAKRRFLSELGLYVTRPHRAVLLVLTIILAVSALWTARTDPALVFTAALDMSWKLLGVIGGMSIGRKLSDKVGISVRPKK